MTVAGRLVGFLVDHEGRHNPRPVPPQRPVHCPRCRSGDVHGDRPCARRRDLEDDPKRRTHDWHCHACDWSAHVGDDGW